MAVQSPELLIALVVFFGALLVIVMFIAIRSSRRPPVNLEVDQPKAAAPVKAEAPEGKVTADQFEPPTILTTKPKLEEPQAKPTVAAKATEGPVAETKLKDALSSTQKNIWGRLKSLIQSEKPSLDELEEVLYTSDLGPQTVERLMAQIRPHSHEGLEKVRFKLKEEFQRIFSESHVGEPVAQNPLALLQNHHSPTVWMIVGVNGAGKTTTIGKISALLAQQGKKVLVAAGDTFRAAAGSQLKVWTERAQVEIFHPEGITDPSAVAFDAVTKAKARGYDFVLIDTAGRLHTQGHLMDELKKVKRVLTKVIPDSPHETLIVLDANNGQNALHQAKEFNQAVALTGIVLTKMDGTAKGGVALAVAQELKLPIRLIGVGEKIQDLRAFSATDFIDSILND